MGRIELLCVCLLIIDNAQCSNMVDDASVLSVVEVTATVIPSIPWRSEEGREGGGERERSRRRGRREREGGEEKQGEGKHCLPA